MAEWKVPTAEELEIIADLNIPANDLMVTRPGDDLKVFMALLERVEIIASKQKNGWKVTVFPSA